MTSALLALLLLTLAVLIWRAVMRDRRDYARFKRLRSTARRRRVLGRWLLESLLVLGGLSAILLVASARYVPDALGAIRAWGPLAGVDWDGGLVQGALVAFLVASVVFMVLPVLVLRRRHEEIPAIGDIRAILPRNRGELPYGAGLAVTAGVVEELLFRLALPALVFGLTGSAPAAFLGAAVVFGLLHVYQGPLGILFSFVLGLVFTALYVASGTILVPILYHALVDLRSLVLIPVVLGGVLGATPTEGRSPSGEHQPTR